MANYFVGDIQGCYKELKLLLKRVEFNPKEDTLWPCGDLVARGPDSLKTLRYLVELGEACKPVLGNHDLHLLAIGEGIKQAKPSDKLDALLNAKDRDNLFNWLGQQPLIRQVPNSDVILVHAGLAPDLSIKKALKQSAKVTAVLNSDERVNFLQQMYGNEPTQWQDARTAMDKMRYAINSCTRMRFCHKDGRLEFEHKSAPNSNATSLIPWFELSPSLENNRVVFGHWAALMGKTQHVNAIGLDTGCVWGNWLTLWRLEDEQYFTQQSLSAA